MHLSASTIINDSVSNSSGDDLGKIEDLMIDTQTGNVDYAVVSFGGFLGIGNKLFAVPLQAMQVDTKNKQFLLNESKEHLKNAPGFDKDDWPRSPDPEYSMQVRKYYRVV